jgi:hypothetical protein
MQLSTGVNAGFVRHMPPLEKLGLGLGPRQPDPRNAQVGYAVLGSLQAFIWLTRRNLPAAKWCQHEKAARKPFLVVI